MTEAQFLAALQQVNSKAQRDWLDVIVHETPLDSLDLIELRSTLEVKLGGPLSDALWFESETLGELLKALQ